MILTHVATTFGLLAFAVFVIVAAYKFIMAAHLHQREPRPDFRIVVRRHGAGYQAFLDKYPLRWEFGLTQETAIGRLITTYVNAYPGWWPLGQPSIELRG
jgi:hypothetical protein